MRRTTAAVWLCVATLVVGACAGQERVDDGGTGVVGGTTTPIPSASPSTGGTGGETTVGARPRTGTPTTERPSTSPSSATSPPATSGGGGGDAPSGAHADDGRTGPPGAYARTLLRAAPATSIALEVLTQSGVSLRDGTLAFVEDALEAATAKDVASTGRTVSEGATATWDESSIVAFADRHRQVDATPTRATIAFLVLRGGFGPDENAIGVAVRGDVFAIFADRISGASTPLVDSHAIEQAVAMHEIGHILGLVDIAIDRGRDDPDHPFHSRNRGSVMFWAIETDLVGQILNGPPPRTFDREDNADLAALRAGA